LLSGRRRLLFIAPLRGGNFAADRKHFGEGRIVMKWLNTFLRDEQGQDLIEYTLLITFIAVATAAVVGQGQNSIRAIWTSSNSSIQAANTSAS